MSLDRGRGATRTTTATLEGYRGPVIVAIGLATAGMALALSGSPPQAIVAPLFLGGGVVAIVGLGLAGYDYSHRSGADLLERGIWQASGPVLAPPLPDAVTLMALGLNLREGDPVVVTHLPAGWLNDLPPEDQDGIRAVLGAPIRFEAYEADDRVEVSFIDARPRPLGPLERGVGTASML